MEAVIHTCLFQLDNEWVFEKQQREKKGTVIISVFPPKTQDHSDHGSSACPTAC